MNILELAILKKMVGGGGGSGTDNYNDLSNLPQINGETLAGNKTAENLGLQDALTFDSTPTEDSTNPVESGGVYSELAKKQDKLTFDGTYDASTNKAATESTVTNAINELDVSETSFDADETIDTISETDGKITVTKKDIAIASNQVTSMTGYTKPSSAPADPAIQTNDTANQAFGKLEFKADTNQTNILYGIKTGVKNIIVLPDGVYQPSSKTKFTVVDGAVTCETTASYTDAVYISNFVIPAGTYSFTSTENNTGFQVRLYTNGTRIEGNPFTLDVDTEVNIALYSLGSNSSGTLTPMICLKSIYDQDSSYAKPTRQNYDLTRLEAEDRAGLIDVVDSGAKNLYDISAFAGYTSSELTMSKPSNGTITVTGTVAGTFVGVDLTTVTLAAGTYVLSGCPSGGGDSTYMLQINSPFYAEDVGNGAVFTLTSPTSITVRIRISKTTSSITKVFSPMICTKAAFGVSSKFVPYRPNYDLVANSVWKVMYKNYSATTADTYEYTGYSVTVPAHQIFEIMGSDRYKDANPTAIAITSTNVSPDTSQYANVYAESAGNTTANKAFASRTVTVLTPYSDNDATYYFFAKHNTTSSNPISLAYRRIM